MSRSEDRKGMGSRAVRSVGLVVAVIALGLFVAACGGGSDSTSSSDSGSSEADSSKKVVFVLPSLGNQAYTRELSGAEEAAEKDPSLDLTVVAPGTGVGQANTLIPKIQDALTQQPDAIVINGGAASPSLVSTLNKAVDDGVKVVTFDVEIPDVPTETFVNIDDEYSSALAGKYVKKRLPDGGELGLFACYPSNPVTIGRVQGFYKGLEGWKGWDGKPVAAVDTKCETEAAVTGMENMLTAHPSLAVVYSTTDQDAVGIVKALEGSDKDVLVVAHDASKESAEEILAGTIAADVDNPFEEIGATAVEAGAKAAAGEPSPKQILIKSELVTKDNAQEYLESIKE